MTKHFEATASQADQLLARARWIVKDRHDPGEVFRRLTPLILSKCGPSERSDLIEMLRTVAGADGNRDEIVVQDIARLAQSLR